jgi:probable HAF family extracellular repeat protein
MEGLGSLQPGLVPDGSAFGVSSEGTVIVGYSYNLAGCIEAFRWTEERGMEGLGDLPGGEFRSIALDVSRDGAVLVGEGAIAAWDPDVAGREAFMWDRYHGMRSLKQVLERECGFRLDGWHLTSAEGVSDDGLTVTGLAIDPSGERSGWVARLCPLVVVGPMTPLANAGGPYEFCPQRQPWWLNGLASTNPDEGRSEPGFPGDTITEYAWDLDGDGEFGDALGPAPEVTTLFAGRPPGAYSIRLRVTDRSAASYPSLGGGHLSHTDSAEVLVRAATDPECPCVEDLVARAKRGKVQLTWTDTGAAQYRVYRSQVSGGPYAYLGSTASRCTAYLDMNVVNGMSFYYVVREWAPAVGERCQSNEASATPSAR